MTPAIHIIAFDIPWPPNYGGVIDVYYKLVHLRRMGVRVILHTFLYHRKPQKELEEICEKVFYYERKTGLCSLLSATPYIVQSRRSDDLINNLCKDSHPILFEGLHSCFYLADPRLASRHKIYRESNIEHHYYRHLALAERSLLKRMFFRMESRKLERYEAVLESASVVLAVSNDDTQYLAGRFPSKRVSWLPSFHKDDEVTSSPGKGTYVLYQGNLSVPENEAAAWYILREIYLDDMPELIIAGMNPSKKLIALAASRPNVRLIPNPGEAEMAGLIRNAHVNLMVTFQPTGLKLKLLNALFNGRFTLVNPPMLAGTGLESLCSVASTPEAFRSVIRELFTRSFTENDCMKRKTEMPGIYSNMNNAAILLKVIEGNS